MQHEERSKGEKIKICKEKLPDFIMDYYIIAATWTSESKMEDWDTLPGTKII